MNCIEDTPFALVSGINGAVMRVQKAEQVVTLPYTLIGFEVDDLEATVTRIQAASVNLEHYGFLRQDVNGSWTTPDGTKIAWRKDPDDNVISCSQSPSTS